MRCKKHDIPDRECPGCFNEAQPPFNPECKKCGGYGYKDLYTDHLEQSVAEPCDCIDKEFMTGKVLVGDWFSGYPAITAMFYGDTLSKASVKGIVIHCGSSNRPTFGRYFSRPLDRDPVTKRLRYRKVSAHAAVLDDGTIEQYVPFSKRAYHCRGHNHDTVGWEHQGPYDRDAWPAIVQEKNIELAKKYMEIYPKIDRVYAHSYLDPTRRRDPGPNFPFEIFETIGLRVFK